MINKGWWKTLRFGTTSKLIKRMSSIVSRRSFERMRVFKIVSWSFLWGRVSKRVLLTRVHEFIRFYRFWPIYMIDIKIKTNQKDGRLRCNGSYYFYRWTYLYMHQTQTRVLIPDFSSSSSNWDWTRIAWSRKVNRLERSSNKRLSWSSTCRYRSSTETSVWLFPVITRERDSKFVRREWSLGWICEEDSVLCPA